MAVKKNSVQEYLKDVREKVPPHWLVWEEIMEKMEDAKRMQALNRDTMIDTCLKDLLFFQFSRQEKEVEELLFDPKGFGHLSTMPNKAKMAYALSLIDKRTLNDLRKIHNIRNKFAHNTDMNFESDEVHQEVRKLSERKKSVTMKNSYELYCTASNACSKAILRALVKEIDKVSGSTKKRRKPSRKRSGIKGVM